MAGKNFRESSHINVFWSLDRWILASYSRSIRNFGASPGFLIPWLQSVWRNAPFFTVTYYLFVLLKINFLFPQILLDILCFSCVFYLCKICLFCTRLCWQSLVTIDKLTGHFLKWAINLTLHILICLWKDVLKWPLFSVLPVGTWDIKGGATEADSSGNWSPVWLL